jgi:hypothetical protein
MCLQRIQVFWDVTLCHWASCLQHSEGPQCRHLHSQAVVFLNCLTLKIKAQWSFETCCTSRQNNTASHPRRLESFATPLWEYQILHGCATFTVLCMYVCFSIQMSACNNLITAEQTLTEFATVEYYHNLSTYSDSAYNWAAITNTLNKFLWASWP